MNADRRKQIERVERSLADIKTLAETAKRDITDIKSEEEEAKEGLPESQQDGDKGQAMDSAIGDLESADQEVDDIILSVDQGVRYLAAAREP